MWSSLGDRLANLGDALTTSAEAHAKRMRAEQQKQYEQLDTDGRAVTPNEGTVVQLPPPPSAFGAATENPSESTESQQEQQQQQQQAAAAVTGSNWTASLTTSLSDKQSQKAVLTSLRSWTTSVVQSTKHLVDETREVWEKEQARIQATAPSLFARGPYKRDVHLPLDVDALRDAEVVYITDRIVTLSHPYMQSTTDGDITPERKLAAVGQLLQKRHEGRFMVWNLSEVEYDTSVLDDQVLVYKFPGSPSPPLGLLLKLLLSIESWLKADERNVAVLHCLTGRGRTSTVLAAFLCWTGEAGFNDVNVALEYIARCKRVAVEALTIPSQVRYISYFANMLDGVRPSQPPLMLKRIIMSDAPMFGRRQPINSDGIDDSTTESLVGCAPYLQIFKAGNLIFTTAASVNYAQTKDDLPFCSVGDGPVSFLTEAIVQGDILLRCRHLTRSGQRISMFRCAFHTGYVPPKVLRLTKAQLDGACADKRFSDDFFLDLIFEPCDEATASKHLVANSEKAGTGVVDGKTKGEEEGQNEAAARRSMGTVVHSENTFTASAYDSMLHRDSRFWDVITERRKENMEKMAQLERQGEGSKPESKEDRNLPLAGPTIGRRRDFSTEQSRENADEDASDHEGASGTNSDSSKLQQNPMGAFSIGEEFGIELDTSKIPTSDVTPSSPPPRPKQDALMDALNDLDTDLFDDDNIHHDAAGPMTEEIVFETDATESKPSPPTVAEKTANAEVSSRPYAGEKESAETSTEATDTNPSDLQEDNPAPDIPIEDGILGGVEEDLANLNFENDTGDEALLGDIEEFDDFDDLDDDAELEDLENFLTQVSSK
ncbi:hypothetical protein HJC23_010512 [Cyclotella cryptica]|uniref:Phosphatidylinositol-3,4,5-trisphosphate 3-phosphatase n=1 Tax=Cyclotella cryptica TaxID=29204 RepID=A0ABD3QCB5_9STRA|eukprot:CCRYP_007077-RA/>CCRYP_007077-RA protein AED:0.31 eAED:0.31 QI:176/1/1/1/0/0.5/2/60/828